MSKSDGSGHFTGTQTPGTNVHMAGRTVDDCLHALDVGLPGTIGTSVGVGNLDAEGHALIAELTLCHIVEAPPCLCFSVPAEQLLYNSRPFCRLQEKVLQNPDFSCAAGSGARILRKALPKTAKVVKITVRDYVRPKRRLLLWTTADTR